MIAVMNKKGLIIILAVAIIGTGVLYEYTRTRVAESAPLDEFAKCLTSKGATMYGNYNCPNCQSEKEAFGSSFKYINYVECVETPKECISRSIEAVPTWIFPALSADRPALSADRSDDRRFVGEQGLEKLSEESGCALPPNSL